jgi:hypothetical protein
VVNAPVATKEILRLCMLIQVLPRIKLRSIIGIAAVKEMWIRSPF